MMRRRHDKPERLEKPSSALAMDLAGGDIAAFEDLYFRIGPGLRAYLKSLGWNDADADDGLQDVFLKMWKTRSRFRQAKSPASFAFRVARNHAIDRSRERARRNRLEGAWTDAIAAAALAGPGTLRALEGLDEQRRIIAAVFDLPDHLRSVLVLKKLGNLSTVEVADVLGIPAGTVASRLWNALRRIQSVLERSSDRVLTSEGLPS